MRSCLLIVAAFALGVAGQSCPTFQTNDFATVLAPRCAIASAAALPGTCDHTFFAALTVGNAGAMPGLRDQFLDCWPYDTGAGGTLPCCVDQCRRYASPSRCASDNNCVNLPGPQGGTASTCVNKNKLCMLFGSQGCGSKYWFCSNVTGSGSSVPCHYVNPTPAQAAEGQSVNDVCPAMHPVVIAMLALMFITFVAAVITVAVVVQRRQKAADEEEERRMQAEAAAAEAKRQRMQRRA